MILDFVVFFVKVGGRHDSKSKVGEKYLCSYHRCTRGVGICSHDGTMIQVPALSFYLKTWSDVASTLRCITALLGVIKLPARALCYTTICHTGHWVSPHGVMFLLPSKAGGQNLKTKN